MTEQETETEVDILTAALGYAALGWSVFPVQGRCAYGDNPTPCQFGFVDPFG